MSAAQAIAFERDSKRWYDLIDHPKQLALMHDRVRFKVVPAGRRSGKTERAKRFIAKQAMAHPGEAYFLAAPTRDQVKRIYWADMKALCMTSAAPKAPSESDLTITLPNKASVSLIGLDKPERMEGVLWSGGVVDEIADVKESAWQENIRPALDTFDPLKPEYRAWCWLIGVPDGLNHFYDLAEYAEHSGDPEWKLYHWKSSEILPADVIEAAKRQMGKRQFKQEYEASFETASGRIYDDYSRDNFTDATILPHEQLCWTHDQNYTPLSSAIAVVRPIERNGRQVMVPHVLDEIILTSAVARQSALEFVDKFKDHANRTVRIYGDPHGRVGEKHGHESDYTEIEAVLRDHNWKFERRIKPSIESIKDGQNAVRAKICNAAGEISLFVNPNNAPYSHKALATGQLKKGSTFLEEDSEFQHVGSAIRYFVEYEWPVGGEAMQKIRIGGV
jgi:hypothetical protein